MNTDRFVHLRGVLAATPSRRALTRGLASVVAGSVLAPLIDFVNIAAKKKKKKKKKKINKDKECRKMFGGPYCPEVKFDVPCCFDGEVCVECGCCPIEKQQCCSGKNNPFCCPENSTCCVFSDGGGDCCAPGEVCRTGGCSRA